MIILDSLLIGGLRFVLDKIATAVDAELNDDAALREALLAAQMRLELGEIAEEEYARTEREILQRIGEIHRRDAEGTASSGRYTVESVEAAAGDDEGGETG